MMRGAQTKILEPWEWRLVAIELAVLLIIWLAPDSRLTATVKRDLAIVVVGIIAFTVTLNIVAVIYVLLGEHQLTLRRPQPFDARLVWPGFRRARSRSGAGGADPALPASRRPSSPGARGSAVPPAAAPRAHP